MVWASLWDACRDAELPARDYVDVVLRTAAVETVPTQLRNVLAQASLAAPRAEMEIRVSGLGNDSSLVGAAELAFEPLLADPVGGLAAACLDADAALAS